MNNNHVDCRISNLEFLKKSYNTAKGQAFDVDSKAMEHHIAVNLFKDFSTGCYQMTIGCNDDIVGITSDGKKYHIVAILLLYDCDYSMVDRYLYNGKMYVLDDDGVKCECVVTDEGNGILEIKNIATVPPFQRKGYAKALIEFLVEKYRRQFSILQVGTGDSPLTIPFYEKCGFVRSHTVPNFFTDHYDHPIYECGVHLVDMVYLQRPL